MATTSQITVTVPAAVAIGAAPVPQSRPSRQVSCFQIGTETFERVDREPRRVERFGAMWRRDDGEHGGLADRQLAGAVDQRHPAGVGPAPAQLAGEVGEARHDLGLVGLVDQVLDPVTALGVVAHGAAEQDDRPAIGPYRPVVDRADGQLASASAPASRRRSRVPARAAS